MPASRNDTSEVSQPAVVASATVSSMVRSATTDPEAFVRDLSAWVLVGPPPAEEASEWSFRTLSARTVRDASGAVEAVLDDTYVVHPVKKARSGPFASTILVGRSRTNDICVRHSSVSKLHARIRVAEDGLYVSDAGSSNGTQVNGEPLTPNVDLRLEHGQQVRFGACSFQVFEPQRFASLLARFSRSRG